MASASEGSNDPLGMGRFIARLPQEVNVGVEYPLMRKATRRPRIVNANQAERLLVIIRPTELVHPTTPQHQQQLHASGYA